ncbi:GFA family protein [Chondromyces apiculatus]|uniref:CENP-V/GFA domain-containing protein n=1 Tax=Chondromyces apiculatus DSM 436 TaxID=1192034 RepID=A0A017TF87_9BACT|nr:GFA family protein [Chondromyces apiculatus]EYF07281.1 Hypothetical protein CAP_0760 [Chondromyces apiculatus DSM 436]
MAQHADAPPADKKKHTGSCHCGKVRFEVLADLSGGGNRCNCTLCTKLNGTWVYTAPAEFTLLSDEDTCSTYAQPGRAAKRYFCKACGVHLFGRDHLEELGGDFVAVNLNCFDDLDPSTVTPHHWDGRHDNWEGGTRDTPWPIFTT